MVGLELLRLSSRLQMEWLWPLTMFSAYLQTSVRHLSVVLQLVTDLSSLATVISQQTSISYFNRILTNQLSRLLNDTSAMTLFLPEDSAWDVLHPVERLYLESDFASDDLHKILEMHAVVKDGVTWSDSFEGDLNRKQLMLLYLIFHSLLG
jgi:hypothetical protein